MLSSLARQTVARVGLRSTATTLLPTATTSTLQDNQGHRGQKRDFSAAAVPSSLWNLGRLNHVAIATPDLQKSVSLYRDILGATVSDPQDLPEHGVTVVFVNLENTKLELLHPLGPKSPIKGFLDKNANGGIHHVCIEVDSITEAVKDLKAKKIRCLAEEPKIGAHGKPVMFLHPKDCAGVLVELEQT